MARPKIDMHSITHGASPPVLTEITQALIDFRRGPYFVHQCAIVAAFLSLGAGSVFLSWGISQSSNILVWAGLCWFMLSFALWVSLGVVVLWMVGSLNIVVVRETRRQRR